MHVSDLIAQLDLAPPPIFLNGSRLWRRLGFKSGLHAWELMVEATADAGAGDIPDAEHSIRRTPVITREQWDEVAAAEVKRRACEISVLYQRGGASLADDAVACRVDPLHWLDHYGVVQDPHARDPKLVDLPLVTFPHQRALFVWVDRALDAPEPSSLLLNKGRSLGATWVLMHVPVRRLLFGRGFAARVGSLRLREVDNGPGDTDALMGKARYILDALPAHLSPTYSSEQRDDEETRSIATLITNGKLDSRLSGSATTADFGRSTRQRLLLWDEFARIHPRIQGAARTAMTTVAHVDVLLSTPAERGTRFHDEFQHAPEHDKLVMPWAVDPRRDDAYILDQYITRGGRLTRAEVLREHGCTFVALEGVQVWTVPESVIYQDEDMPPNARRRLAHLGAMDFGTGPSATTYVHLMPQWEAIHKDGRITAYRLARLLVDLSLEWHRTMEADIADDIRRSWERDYAGQWSILGDHAGIATGPGQTSVIAELQAAGLGVKPAPPHYMDRDHKDRVINVIQEWMDSGVLRFHGERAARLYQAVEAWTYQVPRGVSVSEVSRDVITPTKDDHSHHADALIIGVSALLDGVTKPAVKVAQRRAAPVSRGAALGRL